MKNLTILISLILYFTFSKLLAQDYVIKVGPYFYWTDKYNAEHYILTDDLEFNERLEKTFLLVRPVRIKGQIRNY